MNRSNVVPFPPRNVVRIRDDVSLAELGYALSSAGLCLNTIQTAAGPRLEIRPIPLFLRPQPQPTEGDRT